jgi:hypothetical protein
LYLFIQIFLYFLLFNLYLFLTILLIYLWILIIIIILFNIFSIIFLNGISIIFLNSISIIFLNNFSILFLNKNGVIFLHFLYKILFCMQSLFNLLSPRFIFQWNTLFQFLRHFTINTFRFIERTCIFWKTIKNVFIPNFIIFCNLQNLVKIFIFIQTHYIFILIRFECRIYLF